MAYTRKYRQSEKGRANLRESRVNYCKNFPKKSKAYKKVWWALLSGKLVTPKLCEGCGVDSALHAHHCDYDKPLVVVFYCPKCHVEWHKKNGEGKNGK